MSEDLDVTERLLRIEAWIAGFSNILDRHELGEGEAHIIESKMRVLGSDFFRLSTEEFVQHIQKEIRA